MPNPPYGQQQPQAQPQQQPYPYDAQPGGYPQTYPQQGYGQPEYPGYPQQPVKKSNNALIATVAAAVLVVGGGIAAAVMLTGKSDNPTPTAGGGSSQAVSTQSASADSSSPSPSSQNSDSSSSGGKLVIPKSVSGLKLLSNTDAKSAVKSMSDSLAEDSELYPDPVIGAYNDGGGDNVTELFENQAIADLGSAGQDELSSYDAATIVSQLMTGAGINNAKDEDTTASDGALSCGSRKVNSVSVTFCFWDDNTSFGGLEFFDTGTLSHQAAAADAIRQASEGS
jgi:hypothetical protein